MKKWFFPPFSGKGTFPLPIDLQQSIDKGMLTVRLNGDMTGIMISQTLLGRKTTYGIFYYHMAAHPNRYRVIDDTVTTVINGLPIKVRVRKFAIRQDFVNHHVIHWFDEEGGRHYSTEYHGGVAISHVKWARIAMPEFGMSIRHEERIDIPTGYRRYGPRITGPSEMSNDGPVIYRDLSMKEIPFEDVKELLGWPEEWTPFSAEVKRRFTDEEATAMYLTYG